MEQAPENGKESSRSAHASGVKEWILHICFICATYYAVFFVFKFIGYQIQHKNGQLEILIGKGTFVNYLYRFRAAYWSDPLVIIVRLKTSWTFCMVTILYYTAPRSYHIKSCVYNLLPCLISESCVKWHCSCSHITNIDTCSGFFMMD